jgi:hypothetical protein
VLDEPESDDEDDEPQGEDRDDERSGTKYNVGLMFEKPVLWDAKS